MIESCHNVRGQPCIYRGRPSASLCLMHCSATWSIFLHASSTWLYRVSLQHSWCTIVLWIGVHECFCYFEMQSN